MKTRIVRQGKAVVEPDGNGFLVMFPDGQVTAFGTTRQVEKAVKRWFAAHTGATEVGIGYTEWRRCKPAEKEA